MIRVMKFGGTSVADTERIGQVADRAIAAQRAGNQIVVVVSAMAGETNRLLALAEQVGVGGASRELDLIAATGEQISAGLMALAIRKRGVAARSILGHQARILTDANFGAAGVERVETGAILAALGAGEIAVVAGFQGVTAAGEITTLGRGGSDTTAVALAAALDARSCAIYTDVDGVYTADPAVCPDARKLARVSFDAMLALAERGAKVLHAPCVAMARDHGVPILVAHAHRDHEGTWVTDQGDPDPMVGLALDRTAVALAPRSSHAIRAQAALARADIAFDRSGERFVISAASLARATAELAAHGVTELASEEVARISLIGREATAVTSAALERALAERRITLATSPDLTTVIAPRPGADDLARVLHAALLASLRRYPLVA